jgi:hypothetical protein
VAIPKEVVQHQGKGAETNLNQNDNVLWGDSVSTQQNGRVRIGLNDGSFLNIGARSTMRIVQHDAASQQTDVELTLGHMRGEVVKLTKGGARFETRTPTAVIGVVGTIVMVQATPTLTRVWSVKDDVTVRNINPGVVGSVTLHTGQFTSVRFGFPPGVPTTLPANQMQQEINNTNAGPGGPAGAAGAGQGGTGGQAGTIANAANGGAPSVVNVAVAGTSVGLGGVVVQQVAAARNNTHAADTSLSAAAAASSQAATSATSASNAASQAQNATQQASSISQTTATTVNNVTTGCGCVSPTGP